MDAPNPKRPRCKVSSSALKTTSLPVSPSPNESKFGPIISTLLSFPPSSLSLPSPSSFQKLLDTALASISDDISVQNSHIDLQFASLLQESAKGCLRTRATIHNSDSWSLPPELTILVFSKLDTKSLMQAMVCCTMFEKYAMDPLCYSHINLTTAAENVDNDVVRTMIRRAGKELRFLELGHVEHSSISTSPLLTGPCLHPLTQKRGFIGKCLRTVHLYNVKPMTAKSGKSSFAGLVACSNIIDLKIVGQSPSERLLKSLTENCRFIEHLFLETSSYQADSRKEFEDFLTNIPNLTSLTLIGFGINDATVHKLLENARNKLRYINLTRNFEMKDHFLRDSGHNFNDSPLETLILRDCSLEETEVVQFLNSLSTGSFSFISYIDVSNKYGLVSNGRRRYYTPNFPLEKLKKTRPGVTFVANFPVIKGSERLGAQITDDSSSDSSSRDSSSDSSSDSD